MRGVELCSAEREVISRELAVGRSIRSVGRLLGRDHSMLSDVRLGEQVVLPGLDLATVGCGDLPVAPHAGHGE